MFEVVARGSLLTIYILTLSAVHHLILIVQSSPPSTKETLQKITHLVKCEERKINWLGCNRKVATMSISFAQS